MADISFVHFASTGKQLATRRMVEQVRSLYPDSYYYLVSDAVDDHTELADQYQLDFNLAPVKLGYPVYPKGYAGQAVYEWLLRLRRGCESAKTSHVVMMEDDVLVRKPITVQDNWAIAAHELNPDGLGNAIAPEVIEIIEVFAGKKPVTHQYASGGGSIFNTKIFLDNFNRVSEFFLEHTDVIAENFYPQIGWIDCFMTVYYMLAGHDYTINPHLTDTHNHRPGFDWDGFVAAQPEHIEIINNYKKYYWTDDDK